MKKSAPHGGVPIFFTPNDSHGGVSIFLRPMIFLRPRVWVVGGVSVVISC